MSKMPAERLLSAMQVGLSKADELGEPSSIAVCDAGGNLVAFLRSEEAVYASIEFAIGKAYTAAAFRLKTSDLRTDAQLANDFYGFTPSSGPRAFVVYGGGLPIFLGQDFVGGVGVSGGPVTADEEIAAVVLQALES